MKVIRSNNVTLLSLAVFAVIVAAFLYALNMERKVYASYDAEVTMHEAMAAVRSLQLDARALQSERANILSITREWDEARVNFDQVLQKLSQELTPISNNLPQLKRMANTWQRMESVHAKVRNSMDALDRTGLLRQVGNSSLMVKYQELLTQNNGSDLEVAELSLLLFYLEHTDRLIIEIETELLSLARDLRIETSGKIRGSRIAALSVMAAAALVVTILLFRVAQLYESMTKDNAARAAAERAAKASEADLSQTLNAIGDAVIATDSQGRILRANPAAETLLQSGLADLRGKELSDLCRIRNPETKAGTVDPVQLALTGQADFETNGQFILVQSDGNERKVSANSTRMSRTPSGDEGGVVLVLHDMTERQRLEEQIRHTQKLESLGQLAGGVAHDFNNLLQVIKANLAFIQETCRLDDEEREYFKQIDEAAVRATDLTRQLLALGRRQTLQFRELSPEDMVRTFLKLIRRLIGESIDVSFKCQERIDSIMGDAGQMEQVLLNLCVNARDAMPKGGRLSIELRNVHIGEDETAAWPWARPGRFVKLGIADSGEGMSKETLSRIFEPFFTTKSVGKGSGLGLSVVQGIVQQHGGFIHAYSEVEMGTTFSLYFPSQISGRIHGDTLTRAPSQTTVVGSDELILLVEDEAPVRFVASAILRRNGYRVLPAGDGEEALRIALPQLSEISVAVMDVVMPRMGGIDAARRLQELKPNLAIILCTGYAGGIALPELNAEGGWKLLNKPYSNQELLMQVKLVIAGNAPAK